MTIDQHLASAYTTKITLIELTHGGATYYLSDRPYITAATDTPANQPFAPVIRKNGIGRFRWALPHPFRGGPQRGYGSVKLAGTRIQGRDGAGNPVELDLATTDVIGADVAIYLAAPPEQLPYSDKLLVATARVTTQKGGIGEVELGLGDPYPELLEKTWPDQTITTSQGQTLTIPVPIGASSPQTRAELIDAVNARYVFAPGDAELVRVLDNGAQVLMAAPVASYFNDSATAYVTLSSGHGLDTTAPADYYNGCELLGNPLQINATMSYGTVVGWDGANNRLDLDPATATDPTIYGFPTYVTGWRPLHSAGQGSYIQSNGQFELVTATAGKIGLITSGYAPDGDTANPIDTIAGLFNYLATTIAGIPAGSQVIDWAIPGFSDAMVFTFTQPRRLADLLGDLLRGIGGYWVLRRDGTLRVSRYLGGSAGPAGVTKVATFGLEHMLRQPQWWYDDTVINAITYRYDHNGLVVENPAQGIPSYDAEKLPRPYDEARFTKATAPNLPYASEDPLITSWLTAPGNIAAWQLDTAFGVRRYRARITVPMASPALNPGDWITLAGIGAPFDGDWEIWEVIDQVGGRVPTQELTLWR